MINVGQSFQSDQRLEGMQKSFQRFKFHIKIVNLTIFSSFHHHAFVKKSILGHRCADIEANFVAYFDRNGVGKQASKAQIFLVSQDLLKAIHQVS